MKRDRTAVLNHEVWLDMRNDVDYQWVRTLKAKFADREDAKSYAKRQAKKWLGNPLPAAFIVLDVTGGRPSIVQDYCFNCRNSDEP